MKTHIEQLKRTFREWYGLLSISEIMSNKELINAIEDIENMLLSQNILEGV
jgi:hypothetical protein